METKLEAYRAKQRRENFKNNVKNYVKKIFPFYKSKTMIKVEIESEYLTEKLLPKEKILLDEPVEFPIIESDGEDEEDVSIKCCSYPTIIFYSFCFIMWIILYSIFIKLQFGTAFLVLSAILGMYFNTRTGPKPKNEISAYSVFNKNCESIDGTLKAEQFEREIRYGPASVVNITKND